MMKTIIFTGPSLSANEAKVIYPDAEYLPPIACGDLLKVLEQKPTRIAIIDGFFHYQAAVWHKEILFALAQGVTVYGAASMGALRAAELSQFGMIGVGDIFELYQSGALNDDDEVAIAHAGPKAHYEPLSEAMVNIRYTINHAIDQGILSAALGHQLINAAKSIYYPQRNLAKALAAPLFQQYPEVTQFKNELPKLYIDKKREDAIKLVKLLALNKVNPAFTPTLCNHTASLNYLIQYAKASLT